MNRTKRWLSLLLALIMMLCALVACGDKGDGGENSDSEEIAAPLLVANLSKYSIIVPEGGVSDELAIELNDLIMLIDERFGVFLGLREDVIIEGTEYVEGQYEILVGETTRKESIEVLNEIEKYDDYEIKICEDKLVIAGYNEEQLALAVRELIEAITALPESTEHFFNDSMSISYRETYEINKMLIGDTSISEYTIVYSHGTAGKKLAAMLSDAIIEKTGYKLEIVSETQASEDGKKILVGDTKFGVPDDAATHGYYVGCDEKNVYLYGVNIPNIYKAISYVSDIIDSATGETATLDLDLGFVVASNASITTMTFNVLVSNQTAERKSRVLKMIQKYMPDTLGVQEADKSWMTTLNNELKDTYAYVGVGRNSTNANSDGERCAIFYRKGKFNLLDSGTKWLSDTPDKVSKYSGSTYNRIFTYALLERKSDGKQFMHINTHLDHEASEDVKLKQAKVITNFIRSYNKDVPIIISGDFNCDNASLPAKNIISSGFVDASSVAIANTKALGGIDIIFTSSDDIVVFEAFRDGSQIDGGAPSDHSPVIVTYDLK